MDPRAHEEGFDWGLIEPIAQNLFRWPYAKMKMHDCFRVNPDDRPIGSIRKHAGNEGARLGTKFSVKMDGDLIKVWRVPPEETVSARRSNNARLSGGDGGKYLGVLEPPAEGAWSWPLATMEPGQFFHVRHEDKHPERVRAFALLRGGQLSIPFGTKADDPEFPGHARIEYLEGPRSMKSMGGEINYEMLRRWAMDCYGLDADGMKFWGPDRAVEMAEQITKPPKDKVVLAMDFDTFGFEFLPDRVVTMRLAKGTTLALWESGRAVVNPAPASEPEAAASEPLSGIFALIAGPIPEGALGAPGGPLYDHKIKFDTSGEDGDDPVVDLMS